MAVGKGSMERAAKTAGTSQTSAKKAQTAKETPAKKTGKTTKAKAVNAAETIAAPTEEVMEKIVYQTSDGMLGRDAKPNELFGLGDPMPVYYF